MIVTFVMFCTMALSPDGSETCTIAEDDQGPYQTVNECYDRALDMVEDIKKILNVEAEYSYKCEHEIGIFKAIISDTFTDQLKLRIYISHKVVLWNSSV